jgi:hypothetical protein
MLVTFIIFLIGMMGVARGAPQIAKLINGLVFGVQFVFNGGLGALSAEDKGAAIDAVSARMGPTPTIADPAGTGVGWLFVVLFVTLVAYGIGSLKFLRGKRSFIGLLFGVVIGYIFTAFVLRIVAPTASVQLPLPEVLFGPTYAAPATLAAPTGISWLDAFLQWIVTTLNTWAAAGVLGFVFAILIIVFVLYATRLGHRGERRG